MTTVEPLTLTDLPELDLFSPEFAADPHAAARAAREQHWAARSARGAEFLTYETCEAALLDQRFRSGASRLMDYLGEDATAALSGAGRNLLTSEGDDHSALRRVVAPWFTPRRVGELHTTTHALVDRLLDAVAPVGSCEFMDAVARVVPGAVFCWMVGAPEDDGPMLSEWSETLLKAFRSDPDDAPAITAASAELRAYVADLISAKRAAPADDVTSLLLAAVADGSLHDDDVSSVLQEILAASTDNTMHSAAVQLWLLVEHPDQWARLVADPELVSSAVEESMRFEPRVSSTPVLNEESIVFRDVALPAGSISWLNFASAHRDPAVYDDPDRFDVGRRPRKGQLSFGVGRHYCLGAALARMELQVMLGALVERWRDPVLAGEAEVDLTLGATFTRLPVAFTPRGAGPRPDEDQSRSTPSGRGQ